MTLQDLRRGVENTRAEVLEKSEGSGWKAQRAAAEKGGAGRGRVCSVQPRGPGEGLGLCSVSTEKAWYCRGDRVMCYEVALCEPTEEE